MVRFNNQRGFIPILVLILIFAGITAGTVFIGNTYKKSEEIKEDNTISVSTPSATPKANTTQKSKSPSTSTPTSGQRKVTPVPTLRNTYYPYPTPTSAVTKSPTAIPEPNDPGNPKKGVFIGG